MRLVKSGFVFMTAKNAIFSFINKWSRSIQHFVALRFNYYDVFIVKKKFRN